MSPLWECAPAARGPATSAKGRTDGQVLCWRQTDPCWRTRPAITPFEGPAAKTPKLNERAAKLEEGGYLGTRPPMPPFCTGRSFAQPRGARRMRASAQALVQCNSSWLLQLTSQCRLGLGRV